MTLSGLKRSHESSVATSCVVYICDVGVGIGSLTSLLVIAVFKVSALLRYRGLQAASKEEHLQHHGETMRQMSRS